MTGGETASKIAPVRQGGRTPQRRLQLILFATAVLAAIFLYRSVLHYMLDYSIASFGTYWPHRGRLLIHLSGGTIALVTGLFQLWSGLRMRFPSFHRWIGRVYLASVAIGTFAGLWLAFTPAFGLPYGVALGGLALAWSGCTLMGYLAIRNRLVAAHRRWMIRAHVTTFAFVIYRALEIILYGAGATDVAATEIFAAWACWTIPLGTTVLIERVQDKRRQPAAATGSR